MNKVIKFLLGESPLDGYHFGEHPRFKPFFWRKHLRVEWEKQQTRIEELEAQLKERDGIELEYFQHGFIEACRHYCAGCSTTNAALLSANIFNKEYKPKDNKHE